MAESSAQNQNASRFDYVAKRKWGYTPDQVDDFLEKAHELYDLDDGRLTEQTVQRTAFTFTKGGYVTAEVDAALARLERAIIDRETAKQITSGGREAWQTETNRLYQLIAARGGRPTKQRFDRGERKRPSYDIKQVDRFIDRVVAVAADDLGVKSLNPKQTKSLQDFDSNTVANVIFSQHKGARGYDERQVDYYLDVCSQLLGRIEAYARFADYGTSGETEQSADSGNATNVFSVGTDAGQAAPVNTEVKPLFPAEASVSSTAAASADDKPVVPAVPTVPSISSFSTPEPSFEEVHQVEQTIFGDSGSSAVGQTEIDAVQTVDQAKEEGSSSLASLASLTATAQENVNDIPPLAPQSLSSDDSLFSSPVGEPLHDGDEAANTQDKLKGTSDGDGADAPTFTFPPLDKRN
jgi:DivIVA domain-containing protein